MKNVLPIFPALLLFACAGCSSPSASATADDNEAEQRANQMMIQQQEQQTVRSEVDQTVHPAR